MLPIFTKGFITSISLIAAIGAQNAYVLKKGLQRDNVFIVSFLCFFCDFVLMFAGIYGLAELNGILPWFKPVTMIGGILFLLVYGFNCFRSAIKGGAVLVAEDDLNVAKTPFFKAVAITLAITLLNPHVYIDTFFIIGGVGSAYPSDQRLIFALGCVSASFVWFFSLGYGSRLLQPLFNNPRSWQVLDFAIGVFMWTIAYNLLTDLIASGFFAS